MSRTTPHRTTTTGTASDLALTAAGLSLSALSLYTRQLLSPTSDTLQETASASQEVIITQPEQPVQIRKAPAKKSRNTLAARKSREKRLVRYEAQIKDLNAWKENLDAKVREYNASELAARGQLPPIGLENSDPTSVDNRRTRKAKAKEWKLAELWRSVWEAKENKPGITMGRPKL